MKTKNKVLIAVSSLLVVAGVFLSAPLLLAEKQGHEEGEEHSEAAHENHKGEHDDPEKHGHEEGQEHADIEHENHKDEHDDHEKEAEHSEADHETHKDEHGSHEEPDGHKDEGKEDKHEEDDGHGHEEASVDVELSKDQMQRSGIETLQLKKSSVSKRISALSEVKLNQYKTIKVSPSITTRVEKRHVRLGDHVKKGDLLATLHTIATTDMSANVLATADLAASSAELAASIAEAKGELEAATASWQRIKSLGKDAVSGKRYIEARIAKEQAKAKLAAYGKSQSQVKKLLESGSKSVQKHFELRAEQSGMVIKDDFVLGQIVNPEDVLFEISDMDHLWVEANIKPSDVSKIEIGSKASIPVSGKTLQGKVIFIGRLLDEKTRTLPVRIEVNTKGTSLYPGQFVKTSIEGNNRQSAMLIPAEAVLRGADGDWQLFVEVAPGRFVPKEVEIVKNLGDNVVVEGVEEGTVIVSKGTFFVQSELAKGGFEIHNH